MTGVERYAATFARLAARREGAFVPFAVLGDPDPETSLEILRSVGRAGADALELGLPFSDPVADGPAIQAADRRARAAGATVGDAWRIVAAVRKELPELPIGLLVYANLVLHAGAGEFYARAAAAGVDSVLVADAPLIESAPLERVAAEHGIAPVLIAPPNASDARLSEIAARSRGYVYVTSRRGVTGVDAAAALRSEAARVIGRLRAIRPAAAPPLLGFGIATPEHVRQALALGACGAICGSAIAGRIGELRDGAELPGQLAELVREMKAATRSR